MKQAYTMEDAVNPQADATVEAFTQCISEIDRHLEEMRHEQDEIHSAGKRTDATLAEIHEILTRIKAA